MTKRRRKIINLIITLVLAALLIPAAASQSCFAADEEARAQEILDGMSLKDKVAQMMLVAMPSSDAADIQAQYQFGGYLLFGRDFAHNNRKGITKLLRSCQKASDIPMLTAVDEEGGTVVRASCYSQYRYTKFRSPRQVYRAGRFKGTVKDTKTKDRFLKSLGLNTNLGPVADVPYNNGNFIYQRAFSTNARNTGKFVRLTVTQMGEDNVVSCLKHFPGYGNNGDTHGSVIRDSRSRRCFRTRDLKPFKQGIKAGADMIMVSHTVVDAFDKKRPASLSPKVISYLRNEMCYDGVIITDGLGMKGLTEYAGGSSAEAAVRAVEAGNDMLCVTVDHSKCFKALVKAVRNGRISKAQINDSVKRILIMKIRRGLIK